MKILRWTLAAPIAVLAWYATFFVGILVHQAVETSACPAGEIISGSCQNEKVRQLLEGVIVAFIGLSAVAVVGAAAASVPTHKVMTAWVAFGAGGIVAVYFALATEMYVGGVVAVFAGLGTASAITRYFPTSMPKRQPAIAT